MLSTLLLAPPMLHAHVACTIPSLYFTRLPEYGRDLVSPCVAENAKARFSATQGDTVNLIQSSVSTLLAHCRVCSQCLGCLQADALRTALYPMWCVPYP